MKIYVFHTGMIADNRIAEYISFVDRDRAKKVNELKQIEDKKRSIAAGIALRIALHCEGIDTGEMIFTTAVHGKPYLKQSVAEKIYYNISHSGDYAVVAIGTEEMGIDIEKIKSCNFHVAKRCFTEREYKFLEDVSEKQQSEVFTAIWTMKESYLKATGEGIRGEMNTLETGIDLAENASFEWKEGKKCFYISKEIKGYIVSLCTFHKMELVELIQITKEMQDAVIKKR